jgi:hypothetical protein
MINRLLYYRIRRETKVLARASTTQPDHFNREVTAASSEQEAAVLPRFA